MLEVQSVTAGYGKTVVLRDVTLTVPDGTAVALLGPNGAGKTTFLRVVSGLIKPSRGRVVLEGQDITGVSPYVLAKKGLCHIPEGRGIFPSLTVRENIVLQAPRKQEAAAIERVVSLFPILGERLGQVAGSLSGGEQQMLAMFRTYITNPKLVIVDEPCLGLSPLLVDQIFESLRMIVSGGTALLLVEQYVTRALGLAQKVVMLDRGRVSFEGNSGDLSAEEIFERYLGVDA